MICDTKPCEQKHGRAKQIVESCMKSLRGYEKHLLTRMLFNDIKAQRGDSPDRWKLVLTPQKDPAKTEARCAWLHLRRGMPLVWWEATNPQCCMVHDLYAEGQDVGASVRKCQLLKSLSTGIYEWKELGDMARFLLRATPRTWWPAMYWKTDAGILLTIW